MFADGESRVANLTDEIRAVRDQPDNLIFAEAKLPQTVLYIGRGANPAYANGDSSLREAERTLLATRFSGCVGLRLECCVQIHSSSFLGISAHNQPDIANPQTSIDRRNQLVEVARRHCREESNRQAETVEIQHLFH